MADLSGFLEGIMRGQLGSIERRREADLEEQKRKREIEEFDRKFALESKRRKTEDERNFEQQKELGAISEEMQIGREERQFGRHRQMRQEEIELSNRERLALEAMKANEQITAFDFELDSLPEPVLKKIYEGGAQTLGAQINPQDTRPEKVKLKELIRGAISNAGADGISWVKSFRAYAQDSLKTHNEAWDIFDESNKALNLLPMTESNKDKRKKLEEYRDAGNIEGMRLISKDVEIPGRSGNEIKDKTAELRGLEDQYSTMANSSVIELKAMEELLTEKYRELSGHFDIPFGAVTIDTNGNPLIPYTGRGSLGIRKRLSEYQRILTTDEDGSGLFKQSVSKKKQGLASEFQPQITELQNEIQEMRKRAVDVIPALDVKIESPMDTSEFNQVVNILNKQNPRAFDGVDIEAIRKGDFTTMPGLVTYSDRPWFDRFLTTIKAKQAEK